MKSFKSFIARKIYSLIIKFDFKLNESVYLWVEYDTEIISNYNHQYTFVATNDKLRFQFDFLRAPHRIFHNVCKLQNVEVLSESGMVVKDKMVLLRSIYDSWGYFTKSGSARKFLPTFKKKNTSLKGIKVFHLSGLLNYNYFHFLIESLPRILDYLDLKRQIPELKILVNYPNKVYFEYFELLNINLEEVIVLSEDVFVPELYISNNKFAQVPDGLLWARNIYSKKYLLELKFKLCSNFVNKLGQKKRIYISRKDAKERNIVNEDDLWISLSKLGFEKVSLTNMPVVYQIDLFFNSEIIVGAHGAGFSNVLFSTNAIVVEIFPSNRRVETLYQLFEVSQLGNNSHVIIEQDAIDLLENMLVDVPQIVSIVKQQLNAINETL